ncbi:MAG: hypothetical protein AAGA30_21840, partial [Planctomycetota bacterium]
VVRHFESVGKHDLAIRVLQRLQKTVMDRTDPAAKQQAWRICKFGLIRNNAVGKPFDLTDIDRNGKQVLPEVFKGQPCLLAFYSPRNANSKKLLQELNVIFQMLKPTGLKLIVIQVEKTPTNVELELNPEWVEISNNPLEESELSQIFKRCPVSHVPYFALIDTKGVLRAINLSMRTIKTRVEKISAEK